MTKQTEALKLALEALEEPHPGIRTSFTDAVTYREKVKQAITALREALAEQPAQQEPVATWTGKWLVGTTQKDVRVYLEQDGFDSHDVRLYVNGNFENVQQCIAYAERLARNMMNCTRAIERAHGIKD